MSISALLFIHKLENVHGIEETPFGPGDEKEGECPIVTGPGICAEMCSSDKFCPRRQKCCSNGCGHVCMEPAWNIQAAPDLL